MAELFPRQETPHSKSKKKKKTVEKAAVSLSKSKRKTNHKWKYRGFRITCKPLVTLKNMQEQKARLDRKDPNNPTQVWKNQDEHELE